MVANSLIQSILRKILGSFCAEDFTQSVDCQLLIDQPRLFCRGKIVLPYPANRANPVGRDVSESGSRGDATVRVAHSGIIDVPANVAYVFHILVIVLSGFYYRPILLKKSFPLSSTRMKAGKSSTVIFQMASMPSSGYSTHSMLRMLLWESTAATPPMVPR